jgi:hypothetical protein
MERDRFDSAAVRQMRKKDVSRQVSAYITYRNSSSVIILGKFVHLTAHSFVSRLRQMGARQRNKSPPFCRATDSHIDARKEWEQNR